MIDLHVTGTVDRAHSAELSERLRGALDSTPELHLWLEEVTEIDASGVGCLLMAKMTGSERGVIVRVESASYPVRAALCRLGLARYLGLEG